MAYVEKQTPEFIGKDNVKSYMISNDSENIMIENQTSPLKETKGFLETKDVNVKSLEEGAYNMNERRSSLSSRSSEIDREMTEYNKELLSSSKRKPEPQNVPGSPSIDIRLSLAALSSRFNESI